MDDSVAPTMADVVLLILPAGLHPARRFKEPHCCTKARAQDLKE